MEQESIGLPQLEVGDHLIEAYNTDDRLLLTDYHIEEEGDLRELREIGIRYAYVKNRDTEISTQPEEKSSQIEPEESNPDRDPMENFRESKQLFQSITEKAENVFRAFRDNEAPNGSFSSLDDSLKQMFEHSQENPVDCHLLRQMKNQNPNTYTHSVNLCLLALLFGTEKDFDDRDLRHLAKGALFHDVGKTNVPQKLIQKEGKLTPGEKKIMRKHPRDGFKILRGQGCDERVKKIVLEHHERPDGSGYPKGMENMDHLSLIVSVLEVYESLTSPQPYRQAFSPEEAYETLKDEFRDMPRAQEIVDDIITTFGIYPVGTYVQLTNQDLAIVTQTNCDNLRNPTVKIIGTPKGSINEPFEVDLHSLEQTPFMKNDKIYSNDLEIQKTIETHDKDFLRKKIPLFLRDRMPEPIN